MAEEQKTDAEILAELPPVVRSIIEASGWQVQLRKIVTQRHFRVDQGGFLEEAVFRFIVGESAAEDLAASIGMELKLDLPTLQDLLSQLDREIFSPMKEELERHIGEGDDEEAAPATAKTPISAATSTPSPYSATPAAKEDDLEAMINAGDDLLDVVRPATKPASATPATPVAAKPPMPAAQKPAPAVTPAIALAPVAVGNPMAAAVEKLGGSVIKPAEVSAPMPSKPAAPDVAAPKASSDPYREPIK